MLRPGTPEHSSLFLLSAPLSLSFSRCVALQDSVIPPQLFTVLHSNTHTRWHCCPLARVCNEDAGRALGAGPTLPLHQSSRALAAAVMQIDRAACLYAPLHPTTPSLPPFVASQTTSRGWASKGTKSRERRRGGRRRRGIEELVVTLFWSLRYLSFFFLNYFSTAWNKHCHFIGNVLFSVSLLSAFTGVAPAKKSPKLVSCCFFYLSSSLFFPAIHYSLILHLLLSKRKYPASSHCLLSPASSLSPLC